MKFLHHLKIVLKSAKASALQVGRTFLAKGQYKIFKLKLQCFHSICDFSIARYIYSIVTKGRIKLDKIDIMKINIEKECENDKHVR